MEMFTLLLIKLKKLKNTITSKIKELIILISSIEKMEIELIVLNEKIKKATEFLEKEIETPKTTNEIQRIKLACQIEYMLNYASILKERIEYDKTV